MTRFDEMLKKKAKGEQINSPVGFEERINGIVTNLPDKNVPRTRKMLRRILLAAAIFLGLATMTAVGSPHVSKMANGMINYYNAPKEFKYLSKQAVFEKYNSEVGATVTNQGIKVTLDNIAVDNNYIVIFYTINSEQPIKLKGDDESPEKWRLSWTAPYFWFKENGRYIEPPAQGEVEAYLEDEYTLKGMQRFAVMDTLEDTLNLELYTEEIFDTLGQWHIAVSVDKSTVAAESLTVNPHIKATVTSDWKGERSHNITVEKVSISPFGNQLVLSERADSPFTQFALRDENGNYLTVVPTSIYGSNFLFKVTNSFEFIGGSTDMTELTIVPIVSGDDDDNLPGPQRHTVDIGKYPTYIPTSELGGYILENLEITDEKVIATFNQKGPVNITYPHLMLLDEEGEYLDFISYVDDDYNRDTGEIIMTYLPENRNEDLDKIKKIGYFTRALRLNEDESITIKLK